MIKDIDKKIRTVVAEAADFARTARPNLSSSELYTDVLVGHLTGMANRYLENARAFADHGGGTLAKWLVKPGDTVKSGDIIAEIETDKATMEFEAVDEGVIGAILVADGTEGVKVGTVDRTIIERGREPTRSSSSTAPPG